MTGARVLAVGCLAVLFLAGGAAPAAAEGSLITATVIDNSRFHSDSDALVEVDRTANSQRGSGTAGSDHEGSSADMLAALVSVVSGEGEGEDDD
ncbi:hypothetical protein [Streptomyces sp. NPDC051567]|uniref:hypothetical protein n=1 Tax=Streptomyces sp. NPDC051567 TaxID=3365660 RepID=UPI00378D8DBE